MFLHNSKIKIFKMSIFFMLITSHFYGISMRISQKEETQPAYEATQFGVVRQKDGSSCGYHALYNGLTIAKSLKDPSFKDLLESEVDRDRLFGSNDSKWVKSVILKRAKLLARYCITDYLLKNVRNAEILTERPERDCCAFNLSPLWMVLKTGKNLEEEAEIKAFCNMIVDVSGFFAKNLTFNQPGKAICKISGNELIDAFRKEYIRKNRSIDGLYKVFIKTFRCVDFKLKLKIISDSKIKLKTDNNDKKEFYVINWANFLGKNFAKVSNENHDCATVRPGHWLSSQEIEYLIKKEKEADTDIGDIDIFCLDRDMAQLFNPITGEKALINARLNFQDKSYSGTAIFLIYVTNHWISCVVTKNSNEAPKFLFADSLGVNCNAYQHAEALIKLLITPPKLDAKEAPNSHGAENKAGGKSTFGINKDELLPLNLLFNRDNDRIKLETFIEHLKDGDNFNQSILIYGPAKSGKFNLAYSIAKLVDLPFITVDASKSY